MKRLAAGFLTCVAAPAQCIMCRTAAGAQGDGAAHAMDVGIVVLLGPAVALFCGIFVGIFRRVPKNDE